MGRKIILNLAMGIDGYIVPEDGGFEWIVGDDVFIKVKSGKNS